MSSIASVHLRTSPFAEDQLKAFQREFTPHMQPAPLRDYVYAYSPIQQYLDKVKAALQNGDFLISRTGLHLDVWA